MFLKWKKLKEKKNHHWFITRRWHDWKSRECNYDVKAIIFDTITQNEKWMKVFLLWCIISLCGGCCFHFKLTVMLDISIPVLHKKQKLRKVGWICLFLWLEMCIIYPRSLHVHIDISTVKYYRKTTTEGHKLHSVPATLNPTQQERLFFCTLHSAYFSKSWIKENCYFPNIYSCVF